MTAEANGPDQKLKEIFADALERQSAAEREQYLAEACGGDAKLRAQVEALLKAHAQAGEFLEQTVMGEPGEPLAEGPGTVIGRYRLLEKIGEGGFGSVYVAEQAEPVRRRVALKIIKLGMDTRQVVARFEAERQALAMMDHPNIAKVYDAGSTESGRPYFVMELVRGTKITEYCDRERLDPEHRLELFVQVCHAIQHAHQKGIIHRDLKPSNILVSLQDGVPVPKVIDFGIAKATEGRLTDKTLYTAWEQFIGTPAYISPEQAKLSAVDVDTRSDIYSLGVLLYELLTGRTPFDQKDLLDAGVDAMRRTIQEVEPVRPSTRLSALDKGELDTVAAARGAEAPKLIGLLHGDLDWIVMKCLEKDRARRYETADGLAQELERQLAHEPVLARPPSVLYRVRKWARRNRVAFAAGSAVAAGLAIAAVTLALWGLSERVRSKELQRELARQYLRQGQAMGEQGRVINALHWMVRSLDELPAGNPDLKLAIEDNLAAWGEEWVEPEKTFFTDSWVTAADISSNGERVATGAAQGHLKMWSVETAQTEWVVEQAHKGFVRQVVFSSDGDRLLTGGRDDGIARIWAVASGQRVGADMVHQQGLTALTFSLDGRLVLTGSRDGTAQVWSAETGQPLTPPLRHKSKVMSVALSSDGKLALTGGSESMEEGSAKLWSAETGELIWMFPHEAEPVYVVGLSPDGQTAAVGGFKGTVRLWSTASGEPLCPPLWHHGWITALVFSPDGRTILTGCIDGASRLWSVVTGKPLGNAMYAGISWGPAAFSPGGNVVVAAGPDGSVRLHSATTGEPASRPLRHREMYFQGAEFAQDGTRFLTLPYGDAVQLWSVKDCLGKQVILDVETQVHGAKFTADGNRIVVCDLNGVAFWSPANGQPLEMRGPKEANVLAIDLSADGRLMLTGGMEGKGKLWDLVSGEPLPVEFAHSNRVSSVAFSPDGAFVATGGWGRARIWLTATGEALSPWLEHADFVAFSPVAAVLATGGYDGSVQLWTVPDGRLLLRLTGHPQGAGAIDFSPDGRLIATGGEDHTARLWNAETGDPTSIVLVHEDRVKDVTFSPDGRWLLTTSNDCTARLWSVTTGEQIGPSLRHKQFVLGGSFSPDGKQIVAADAVYPRVWNVFTPLTSEQLSNAKLWVENLTLTTMDEDGTVRWLSSEGR